MSDLNVELNLKATDKGLVGSVNKTKKALRSLNTTLSRTEQAAQKTGKSAGILGNHFHRMGAALGLFSVFRQASGKLNSKIKQSTI